MLPGPSPLAGMAGRSRGPAGFISLAPCIWLVRVICGHAVLPEQRFLSPMAIP